MTGRTTGGSWFAFFFLQAPFVVIERLVLRMLKRQGVRVPTWARTAATYVLVVGSAQHLFWGPAKRGGVADAVVGSTREGMLACWHAARQWGLMRPLFL